MSDEGIKLAEALKAATASGVVNILDELAAGAEADLANAVTIEETRSFPDLKKLPLEPNKDGVYVWKKIEDASVVATDLKSSTAVSYTKQDRIGARLYQASTGTCTRVLQQFGPDFVDIQGDGLFAIFAGARHPERAVCAAISLNSFGLKLRTMLKDQFGDDVPEMKESGLRIGADRGVLMVKKIGVRGDHNEPVWAGKPVNYATKCAQAAEAGRVVVTNRFFKDFRENQYVRWSCGHEKGEATGNIGALWLPITVDTIGDDQENARELATSWCDHCGSKFCRAILNGKTDRELNTGQLEKWRKPKEEEQTESEGHVEAA
jgi:class 3 adenylate cyclase